MLVFVLVGPTVHSCTTVRGCVWWPRADSRAEAGHIVALVYSVLLALAVWLGSLDIISHEIQVFTGHKPPDPPKFGISRHARRPVNQCSIDRFGDDPRYVIVVHMFRAMLIIGAGALVVGLTASTPFWMPCAPRARSVPAQVAVACVTLFFPWWAFGQHGRWALGGSAAPAASISWRGLPRRRPSMAFPDDDEAYLRWPGEGRARTTARSARRSAHLERAGTDGHEDST